jgi:hypothetical protein
MDLHGLRLEISLLLIQFNIWWLLVAEAVAVANQPLVPVAAVEQAAIEQHQDIQ